MFFEALFGAFGFVDVLVTAVRRYNVLVELICWLYCSSYDVVWSNTAYLIALFGIVATLLAVRNQNTDGITLLGFGFLALPLGLPAVYEGFRRTKRTTT